jgi:hypothetical protein
MESLAKRDLLGPLVLEVIAATRAIKAQPESKAVKVLLVLEATVATRVKLAKPVPQVPWVQSVPLDKNPTQVTQATRVKQAFKAVSALQALGAIPATPVSPEKRARPVLEAQRDLGATRVPLETLVLRALRVLKATAAQPETRDSKVQWDRVVLSA